VAWQRDSAKAQQCDCRKNLPILTTELEEGRNSTQLEQQPFSCPASAGKAFLGDSARTRSKKPDIKALAVPRTGNVHYEKPAT